MLRLLFLSAACLVLPLAGLLFAQWPLRELVQAYSVQANDLGQICFAVAMAFGVTAASRAGAHLVAGHHRRSPRFVATGVALCVLPWAGFLLWSTTGPVWQSVRTLEKFPETLDPGYFLIRVALWLLVVLVLLHALAGLRRTWSRNA
ncbi:MAG: C4-dicarboxylate ABC transporter substrate-binding protein [Burkholderiales bacterium]|nr:C4-dicarboxylate ABC transporter substrate-binding protein [Burkholderiales bacterium]